MWLREAGKQRPIPGQENLSETGAEIGIADHLIFLFSVLHPQ
jgi:hypothetical protein